ncbi:hypothetical protein EUGRSUZ_F00552 [Eucalyptus grandis]|uniref:Uncharacterized protein n=1 Tax=Eucalyptus grandis TaxID=71139 RepID=A0ACC3KCH5_EUCGR|nr:hypothetical protein EUGRSUZ_F00552 [Eucalyptus grandis]
MGLVDAGKKLLRCRGRRPVLARRAFTFEGCISVTVSWSLSVIKAHSWTCMDIYVFATPYRVTWDYYFLSCEHTFEFKEWEGKAEFEYVKSRGVSIFLMQAGMLGTLQALWDQRPQPWVTNINIDDIHSGDFFAISKVRGRWGGFETLEKWVSGAYAGHTVVCLRDYEGKLWVGESGHDNEQGEDVIAVLPWDEWWEFELNKDDSNPHIALLPLHPDMRAKFNETAAWEYAESMNAKPYGYHNMLFSWIDTIDANYPTPLDAHVVASVMTVWNQMQPAYAANMWNEAINKRLGTEGSDLPDLLIKDAYSLKFLENNSSRLPKWCNDGDNVELPFCQIRGRYRMELPGYNTMDPCPHMNERCPSLPPKYSRPSDC